MSGQLVITVGLPASGKTTFAKGYIKLARDEGLAVSRDDIREKFFGKTGVLEHKDEVIVTEMQERVVNIALAHGKTVVVHDMNLRKKYRTRWLEQARLVGANFQQVDLTWVDLDKCIERDAMRERSVGHAVIRDLHSRFVEPLKGQPALNPMDDPIPAVPEPYRHTTGLPGAIVVDIDGTVAEREPGGRSAYDMTRVSEDLPRQEIINILTNHAYGLRKPPAIIFLSGRDDSCYEETLAWLERYVTVPIAGLYMRSHGDNRDDVIVKRELFDRNVRGKYNVQFVLDDRNKVVKMWREMGLTCLQVQEGAF